MRKFVWVLVSLVVFACADNKKAAQELHVYFGLDSLLDQQIEVLGVGQYELAKTVSMDGETESRTLVPDSSEWVSEFVILRDFDLNKPYNVGAYTEEQQAGKTSYILSDQSLDAPVQYFTIEEADGNIQITSEYFEDKSIYQHRRKLILKLKDDLLRSYEVSGFQKMVMKDTIRYRISGEVKIDE